LNAKRLAAIITALLLLPVCTVANGLQLSGIGAKALAMGGAFRAVADDWTASIWNPAGLAGQRSGYSFEGKILYQVNRITPNAASTTPGLEYYLYHNGTEYSTEAKPISTGSFAYQIKNSDRVSLSFNLSHSSLNNSSWEYLYLGPYTGYENLTYPDVAWRSDIRIFDLHPAVGIRVLKSLSVGIGVSIKSATVLLQKPSLLPSIDPESGDPLSPPFQHTFVQSSFEGEGIGTGYNLGVMMNLTESTRIGITYTSPLTISLEGELQQIPYLPTTITNDSILAIPIVYADLNLPMAIGFGISSQVHPRLLISMDVAYTNWSALDKVEVDLREEHLYGDSTLTADQILNWKNTLRFAVGVNCLLYKPLDFEVRAGYSYDQSPVPDETISPLSLDVADKHILGVGFQSRLNKRLSIEGYWEHIIGAERVVSAGSDINGDSIDDNLPGSWSMQSDTFGLQFNYLIP